ncbi:MAG: hypothetical protein ACXV8O_07655 [Methylobacter sp.]
MENESKLLLGKILGEIYRIQRSSEEVSCPASDCQIYALLNGFEDAVNQELEMIGFISSDQVRSVVDVLEPIWQDVEQLKAFKGFYDIERELQNRGVDRSAAIRVLKYLKANNQFIDIIGKMDSSGSPSECRRFDLSDWDV